MLNEFDVAHERLKKVFEYLKAFHNKRFPPKKDIKQQSWHRWLDTLPEHKSIKKGFSADASETGDDFILRVYRPEKTPAPKPPALIEAWVEHGWESPFQAIEIKSHLDEQTDDGESIAIHFEDDPARVEALNIWREKRDAWKATEIPVHNADKFWRQLHKVHAQLERSPETAELMLGDGILSFHQNNESIYHPLLLQKVRLEFDPETPSLTIYYGEDPVELYATLLQTMTEENSPNLVSKLREEVDNNGELLLSENWNDLLTRLVHHFEDGKFIERGEPPVASPAPATGRRPVLFIRSRTGGITRAIEGVLERIEDGNRPFCSALQRIVGIDGESSEPTHNLGTSSSTYQRLPDKDILLGKPYNAQQTEIAKKLEARGSVLVQGPPGTGKTHTIANLIGHLLAEGKRILVTSHTPKALRVLRSQVHQELQPLCVSLLDRSVEAREELQSSITRILGRTDEIDVEQEEKRARKLTEHRKQKIDELEVILDRIKLSRRKQLEPIYLEQHHVAPFLSPIEAAREVADGKEADGWIPVPVALPDEHLVPMPLTEEEIGTLYESNVKCGLQDEQLVDDPLPSANLLPSPRDLKATVEKEQDLEGKSQDFDNDFWTEIFPEEEALQQFEPRLGDIEEKRAEFIDKEPWQQKVINAAYMAQQDQTPWHELIGCYETLAQLATDSLPYRLQYEPKWQSNEDLETQIEIAEEIADHLGDGGTLGIFTRVTQPEWPAYINQWRVSNRKPKSEEHFHAITRCMQLEIELMQFKRLWSHLFDEFHLPLPRPTGTNIPEAIVQFAHPYIEQIRNLLGWWQNEFYPAIEYFKSLGFKWNTFLASQPPLPAHQLAAFGPIAPVIEATGNPLTRFMVAATAYFELYYLRVNLKALIEALRRFTRPEVGPVIQAIETRSVVAYDEAYQQLVEAIERQRWAKIRRELLNKLRPFAPAWTAGIEGRVEPHGSGHPPSNATQAWRWRQLDLELDKRLAEDEAALNTTASDLRKQIFKLTNQLIDCRTWIAQKNRTTLEMRQALSGWVLTQDAMGAGHVQDLQELQLEARKLLYKCHPAVPVWIMPLTRLAESYDFRDTEFDVAIIDEASQCDVMGLLPLAIAKQVVVVGDDQQVSPTTFEKSSETKALRRNFLAGIPNMHLYNGKMSIYALAGTAFSQTVCLLEHFRCVPEIIQFSNHLSYQGNIKPLRDAASSPMQRYTISHHVEGGIRKGDINEQEAKHVASLIMAANEQPAYQDLTFGVISMVKEKQALRVDEILRSKMSLPDYEHRQIICGNSAQFQGDERNVMFLTLVDEPREGGPLALRRLKLMKQRFNVAASRAKDQMWVVHSLDPNNDLKPGDLRRRLIQHALDPTAISDAFENLEPRAESIFEAKVIAFLRGRGYRVIPQWPAGSYRIDLVVEHHDGKKRLAVECDGERWHTIDNLADDIARQQILERLGWTFHRIRGADYFRDADKSMARLIDRLEQMGIEPAPAEGQIKPQTDELTRNVIARAKEIRDEWAADPSD